MLSGLMRSVLTPVPAPPATERAHPVQTGTSTARRWRGLHWLATLPLLLEAWLVVQRLMPQVTRPLWYDEQWRAFHFSLAGPEFWAGIREANAPLAGGWVALVKLSTSLLGNREVPLRLPGVVAFLLIGVATYALARRFLGTPGSLLVAAAVVVNGSILELALQLKPFGLEVLAAELAFLLWLGAQRPGRGPAARLAGYAGIGLCAVAGTAAAFVVGPLLLVDAVRLARERTLGRFLAPSVAGAIALVHLQGFVLLQTKQTEGDYWDAYFLPGGSLGDKVGFTVDRLSGFFPEVLTARDGVAGAALTFGDAAAWMLAPFLVLALLLGVVAALRSRPGRALLAMLLLSLVAQLVASSMRMWPFGFARTNLFMVPFFYLLAAMGVAWSLSTLRRLAARRAPARSWLEAGPVVRWAMRGLWALWLAAPPRLAPVLGPGRVRRLAGRAPAGGPAVASVALAVLATLAAVNLVSVGQVSMAQLRLAERDNDARPFGAELRGLVRTTRLRTTPTDVVVHVGDMTTKGWLYYMRADYDGYSSAVRPRSTVPPRQTITSADPAVLERFLARNPRARSVFVVIQRGEPAEDINGVYRVLRDTGYTEVAAREQLGPSMVLQVSRTPSPVAGPGPPPP
jgi:hypothetical protein